MSFVKCQGQIWTLNSSAVTVLWTLHFNHSFTDLYQTWYIVSIWNGLEDH